MTTKKITDLTVATVADDTDLLAVVQGGETKQMTREVLTGPGPHEIEHAFNGFALGVLSFIISESGGTVTATVDNSVSPGTDLLTWHSDREHDIVLPASVSLTPGSDISPQINFIYFLASTNTLTKNTSSWPAGEHTRIGVVLCQSATSVGLYGPYKVHQWSDQPYDAGDGGHITHLNEWIRNQHATWKSGCVVTVTGSGTANVTLSTTSGMVYQLHEHSMPAFADPSAFYVPNDFTTVYVRRTALSDITADSTGTSLANKIFGVVVWGVVNAATGDCKLMVNLPSGGYNGSDPESVRGDVDRTVNFSIPEDFLGVGFLIRRLVFKLSGGNYTLYDSTADDLRGFSPNSAPGGASGQSNVFADNTFRIQDDGDSTKEIAFEASGITTGTVRTLTAPDASGTLVLKDSSDILTNKTLDVNGVGNVISNIDIGNCIAASQVEAETGTDNTKLLTALRVAQAIAVLGVAGKVLQDLQTNKTSTFTNTTTSTWVALTGLSQAITPSATSSKVRVTVVLNHGNTAGSAMNPCFRVKRGASVLTVGDVVGSRTSCAAFGVAVDSLSMNSTVIDLLDSPASTSAQTYTVEVFHAYAGTFYLNRESNDTNSTSHPRTICSISTKEIGA